MLNFNAAQKTFIQATQFKDNALYEVYNDEIKVNLQKVNCLKRRYK